jgi:hypothetical protein
MLGGDPVRDPLIDLSQRGRQNVELALARLRFFALLEHCHLAQLIARRGGSGLGNSLTSSARSHAQKAIAQGNEICAVRRLQHEQRPSSHIFTTEQGGPMTLIVSWHAQIVC